ncbi:IS256 family transposase [Sulfobacillus harzensis]|uniref:Mutator family transposase n=1 Tax=Sulfobacillus harzensis TaxID=2729629 RepID=A0A7Y0Q4T9_9FIRM|nr:IS256 family transposase [Sulfobacillus harzensis]
MSLSIPNSPGKPQKKARKTPQTETPPVAWPTATESWVAILQEAQAGLLSLSIRLGLQTLQQLMATEVDGLVGPKGRHNPDRTAVRHGLETGYVYVGDRRVPVTHPRVRTNTGEEVPLQTYQAFQDPTLVTQAALERMLFGLASRQQPHADPALNAALDDTGPSKSTVSRRFIRATRQALDTFLSRPLGDRTWVVLMIDGIRVGGHLAVVALGIDDGGHKQILGLAEGATENSTVVTNLLTDLVDRGFAIPQGALAVIDGAKALAKALRDVFGDALAIQRCTVHKTRNVLDHVADSDQSRIRQRLRKAYQEPTAEEALKALKALAADLEHDYPQAAKSLREGMEDTVTVQRLQLSGTLRQSLATTNALESVNSQFRTHAKNVKRWSNGDQVLRWLAAASLFIEDHLKRLPGYRDLRTLQLALRRFLHLDKRSVGEMVAS